MTPTVIFDFDGTLAVGLGPIEAYLTCVSRLVDAPGFVSAARANLDALEAGGDTFIDAYDAVRVAAEASAIPANVLSQGYMDSRGVLASDLAPLEAPAGLRDFMVELAPHAELMLVTNAPAVRMQESLAALGVDDLLATRVFDARKPEGLVAVVADALRAGPVLSVGDIHANDLAPASALGAATALVGPSFALHADAVTMAARHLPELYPSIKTWATTSSATVPSGTPLSQ